jgi:hypothetical protein
MISTHKTRSYRYIPVPPITLTANTIIDSTMTNETIIKIGELVMDDLERYHEFMSVKEICSVMDVIRLSFEIINKRHLELSK